MPELPEVETVKNGLVELLNLNSGGEPVIASVNLNRKTLRTPISKKIAALKNQPVTSISRRAKFLLWQTPEGYLLNHLGMTGRWREVIKDEQVKHDHVLIHFSDGRTLAYNDPRRFGFLEFVKEKDLGKNKWLKNLGPEPLDLEHFTGEYLFAKTRKRKGPIKNFIMDQKIVVGVGNIYASEALFMAGIRPTLPSYKMTKVRCQKLVRCIQQILQSAIEAGGTTIRDFRQAGGEEGYFALNLKVYGREGESCLACEKPIKKKVIVGRSTYWCSKCQK